MSRKPTPAPTVPAPSSISSMAASQQAHFQDLVQRNRTLEQTIKRLQEELSREQTRAKDAVKQIQTRWQEERVQWREGCDTILACYRIAHLHTAVQLDAEKLALVKQADVVRQEKLSRLQRDYKITEFQIREMEQDSHIADIEQELLELRASREEDIVELTQRHENVVQKWLAKCADLATETASVREALAAAQKAKSKLDEKHSHLLEEMAKLRATADSTASKLERTTLQLDGAQTSNAELQHVNDDLKRNNAEIKRQLDKWQNLENKGGEEVEALRKRRIELEVEVKALEGRQGDADKKEQDITKALEKEKRKVEKLKEILAEWQQATAEAQEDCEKHKSDVAEATKQAAKLQKQVEDIKAGLEVERARVQPSISTLPPKTKKRSQKSLSSPPPEEVEQGQTPSSEDEVALEIATSPTPVKSRTKAHLKPKQILNKTRIEAASDKETASTSGVKRTRNSPIIQVDSDDEQAGTKTVKAKGKRKAVEEDSDTEVVVTKTAKAKGKQKAKDDIDDAIEEAPATRKGKRDTSRAPSQRRDPVEPKRSRTTTSSRAGSVQPKSAQTQVEKDGDEEAGDRDDDEQVPKKKKRKINIFGAAHDTTFAWGQFSQTSNELGIPTVLSPVKQTEMVPNRSASILGKMGSVIGSFRR